MTGRKRRRRRLFLLAMAVLPQVASLPTMAAMLWAVRIKDVISVPATFHTASEQRYVSLGLPAADRPKLQVGSIVYGTVLDAAGRREQEFSAEVVSIREVAKAPRLRWLVEARLIAGSGELLTGRAEGGPPLMVTLWTRTRRALDVVFSRASFSHMASDALSSSTASGAAQ
jgi:hypothetical protein